GGGPGRGAARAAAGERGGGSTEERVRAGRGARAGPRRRPAPPARAGGADDAGSAHRRRGRAAPQLRRAAPAARRAAGGRAMASHALDGDVRRLSYGGRGGDNDDSIGYRLVLPVEVLSDVSFTLPPLDITEM